MKSQIMKCFFSIFLAPAIVILAFGHSAAQQFKPNYDEAKVPKYTLPDPLVMADGAKVASAEDWKNKRRPEVLRLFETHMYGKPLAAGPRR